MQKLPEAKLETPFQTAALTVLALCTYSADRNIGTEMLNWLRGPRPLNGQDISFLNDRFRDGKTYLPFTYFAGSTPDNNYTPAKPYSITIESNHVSGEEQGYMKLLSPAEVPILPVPSSCVSVAQTVSGSCGSSICSPVSARQNPRIHGLDTPMAKAMCFSAHAVMKEEKTNEYLRNLESSRAAYADAGRHKSLYPGKSAA